MTVRNYMEESGNVLPRLCRLPSPAADPCDDGDTMTKLLRGPMRGSIIYTARGIGRCGCGRLISKGDEYVYGAYKVGARDPHERVRVCMDCAAGDGRDTAIPHVAVARTTE